ncbi:MAG: NADP-dependent succinic semialdehyde dehydrogenase [Acidimicrobiales bacterium]
MPIATVNPTTGETLATFDPLDDAEVDARLDRAATTAVSWRATTFAERGRLMTAAAELLEGELPVVATMLTTEMGKTFAAAKGEVAKCAAAMRYFAEHAESMLADEPASTKASDSRAVYRPMGPVLAVMPWNFPLWQVTRFAAPALMAGNVGLLKHSSNVPQTALFIEDLFRRAGFPEGAFQTLLVEARAVEAIVSDDRVRAVTLTGSEGAGRAVARAAGQALKKSVLELGGSDPFVVLPSADLERAVAVGIEARVQNNGQSCIAAKRFVVHDAVYDAFCDAFVRGFEALEVGDPMEPHTAVGPLALEQARRDIEAQVDDARAKGAAVLCGGEAVPGKGWYYRPTVLAEVQPAMRVHEEEVFGPVAMLLRAADTDDALRIANDTSFGLGASVWTSDPAEQRSFVEGLEAGMVFVNAMVASTAELPFGGIKRSGYGRELSAHGIREFCDVKTVWVA